MPEHVDFFIHGPKTVGTTMRRMIEGCYPTGWVESLHLAPPDDAAVRIVAGHVDYGYSAHSSGPFRALRCCASRSIVRKLGLGK